MMADGYTGILCLLEPIRSASREGEREEEAKRSVTGDDASGSDDDGAPRDYIASFSIPPHFTTDVCTSHSLIFDLSDCHSLTTTIFSLPRNRVERSVVINCLTFSHPAYCIPHSLPFLPSYLRLTVCLSV